MLTTWQTGSEHDSVNWSAAARVVVCCIWAAYIGWGCIARIGAVLDPTDWCSWIVYSALVQTVYIAEGVDENPNQITGYKLILSSDCRQSMTKPSSPVCGHCGCNQ